MALDDAPSPPPSATRATRYFEQAGSRSRAPQQLPVCLYLETTNRCNLLCTTCPRTFAELEPPADMSWGLALPMLFAALFALQHGAPARPAQTGAAAGLLAGSITGALYEIHCPENSLLFVAVWHVAAIAVLAGLGAYLGRKLLYW